MWQGLRAITDYKGSSGGVTNTDPSQPDELNLFYARFDRENSEPTTKMVNDDGKRVQRQGSPADAMVQGQQPCTKCQQDQGAHRGLQEPPRAPLPHHLRR